MKHYVYKAIYASLSFHGSQTITDYKLQISDSTQGPLQSAINLIFQLYSTKIGFFESVPFFFFLILFYFISKLYNIVLGFAKHQNESATGIPVLPILHPPPSSLPIPSLWVVPVSVPFLLDLWLYFILSALVSISRKWK